MVTMNRNKVVIVGTGQVSCHRRLSASSRTACAMSLCSSTVPPPRPWGRPATSMMAANSRTATSRCAPATTPTARMRTSSSSPWAASRRPTPTAWPNSGFTVGLVGEVVDNVMASGFDGVIVMVSNPVDVMAWYAWKRSGLPRTQVLGTGTALDTSRLKTIIGEETGLDPRNVGGFVMGEHGDSQFTAWSTVSLGGKPFARFLADNQDRFASVSTTEIEEKTRTRGNEIVAAKGGTNFGIASTVAGIVQTILWDERRIVPVSTLLDGEYGEHDVFLGVPTELRANGANEIVELDLSEGRAGQTAPFRRTRA